MNFAKVTNKIMELCIQDNMINFVGYGDITSFNSESIKDYPVIWLYCPEGITNDENLAIANYYIVYLDRETNRMDDNNSEDLLIQSVGHSILSNIIKKLRNIDIFDVENDIINFTFFDGLEEKSDNCNGIYAQVQISWPITNCVVD